MAETMNNNWPVVKLGEILTERKEKPDLEAILTGEIPIVAKIGFGTGEIDLREESKTKTNMILIKPGDLVISGINAEKGAIAIYGEENKELAAATIHYSSYEINKGKADSLYLWYFLRSRTFRNILLSKLPKGIKTEVKPRRLLPIEIPFPDLEKQKRIVTKIESLMKRIEEVRRLRAVAIKEMEILLGKSIEKYCFKKAHPIVDFGDLIVDAKNGIYKPTIFLGRGVPCIRMFNIHNGKINLSDCILLDVTKEELNKYACNPGDIIFNRVNSRELVGKAGLVPIGHPKCVFESKNIRLRVDLKRTIPKFANYIINSYNSKDYFSGVLKQQCGQATLNRTHLDKMPFPLPSIETQQSIVANLDSLQAKVDELKKLQAETEKELEELVPSILDKAFKGEL